ncbi:MAG: ATP-dependent helicase HrpB [Bdellovibrionales bacterium]|nr:ATP-dependent helicase HrpB [Bdellovibrionales bacterium]
MDLPIDKSLPEIAKCLIAEPAVIVVSPPGSGKTTRVPPLLTQWTSKQVILLQPRRVAVRSSVERIAKEQNWVVGREIGYQIRFEKKGSADSRLMVMTEGVLSKRLQSDPELKGVGAVILDEFHERSLHTDFALGWLSKLLARRSDLRLVVMSATIDSQLLSQFLNKAPVVEALGKSFPLEVEYLSHSLPLHDHRRRNEVLVEKILQVEKQLSPGEALLVFLPGVGEIQSVQKLLQEAGVRIPILQLHGRQKMQQQLLAIDPHPEARIVLATNVAETSITVSGVRYVIDSGMEKVMSYNPQTGVEQLRLQRVSQASAQQRAGRAARLGPGWCLRLWTMAEHKKLMDFLPPEIHRSELTEWVLYLKRSGYLQLEEFPWLSPPKEEFIADAVRTLTLLGWLDRKGEITVLGREIASWPMSPRMAKLVVSASQMGQPLLGIELAALLSEGEYLKEPPIKEETLTYSCDVTHRWELLKEKDRILQRISHGPTLLRIQKNRKQFEKWAHLEADSEASPFLSKSINELLLVCYPDRLCRRRDSQKQKAKMVGGRGVKLSESSCATKGDLFVAIRPVDRGHLTATESMVEWASQVEPQWVQYHFSEWIEEKTWIEERKGQEAKMCSAPLFFDISIVRPKEDRLSIEKKSELLLSQWLENLSFFYEHNPHIGSWMNRVRLTAKYFPDFEGAKDLEQEEMEVLMYLQEDLKQSKQKLTPELVAKAFKEWLPVSTVDLVESQAPEKFSFPHGRSRPIEYFTDRPPVIAVKIQELYGIKEHPSIMSGRCPLQLQLLAPNYKLVQTTSDLSNFWRSSYPEIRKELRIRYSKHLWPEDPLSTGPEYKGSYPKPPEAKKLY